MATLIPTTGTTSFDNAGKRRLAERLGPMRSDGSLWHTVRVGPKQPVSCERDDQAPILIKLPTLHDEVFAITDHLANALAQCKSPHRVRKRSGDYAELAGYCQRRQRVWGKARNMKGLQA